MTLNLDVGKESGAKRFGGTEDIVLATIVSCGRTR